jgi:hypothetical protein
MRRLSETLEDLFGFDNRLNKQQKRRLFYRPLLEVLEDRTVPTTFTVKPGGGGDFTTIGAAVAAPTTNNGDTILVDPGTYHEHVVIGKSLTLKGANAGVNPVTSARGPESVVDGDFTDAPFDIAANNVVLDGFKIIDGQNGFNAGVATSSAYSGYNIVNDIITNNTIGVYANSSGLSTIQNNLFDANNLAGPAGGAGIYSDQGTSSLTITGNEFKNHTLNNPVIIGATSPGANVNLTVTNNKIHDNVSGIFALAVSGGAFECNTITTGGTATALTFGGADTNIDVLNNNFSNNARGLRIADYGYFGTSSPNSDIRVHYNNFANDSEFGLGIKDVGNGPTFPGYSGASLDAAFNWWGSATGPTTAANPGGTGSAIVNDFASPVVNFAPWLVTAPTASTLFWRDTSGNVLTVDTATGNYAFYLTDGTVVSGTGARIQNGVLKIHDQGSSTKGGKRKIDVESAIDGPITVNLRGKDKMSFTLTSFNPGPAC